MKKAFFIGIFSLVLAVTAIPSVQAAPAGGVLNGGTGAPAATTVSLTACTQLSNQGLSALVNCIVGAANVAIYLIISISVVYTVYGAFIMISSEEKREEGKKTIYYGIIGIFVMVSIWGLVNILVKTFSLSGTSATVIPTGPFLEGPAAGTRSNG